MKNTGKRPGKETVQLYINKTDAKVMMPEKQLKAFAKVNVLPGQTTSVTVNVPVKDLAYYSVESKKWIVEPGQYKILAGSSSRDIQQTAAVVINK